MDKQTSDERLLKLIENAGEPKRKQPTAAGINKSLPNSVLARFNPLGLKTKLKNLRIDLAYLNKGLIALSILATLIFLYTLFSAPVIPKSDSAFFTPQGSSAILKLISSEEAQGSMRKNFSIQNIKRDFFLPCGIKSSCNAQEAKQDLSEKFKDLKLVGVIWSQDPEVIIESTKDSRTYSLKKGDTLNGQFKVKEISRSSAILEVVTEEGPKQFEIR